MIWTLIKKEFLDIARDRRTLIMSIGVPMLLFPVLMVVMGKVASSTRKTAEEKVTKVALITHGGAEEFRRILLREGPLLTKKGSITVREDLTLEQGCELIESDSLDVLVYFDPDFERMLRARIPGRVSVYFKRTTDAGRVERGRIVGLLEDYESRLYDRRIAELGIDPPTTLQPVEINEFNLASIRRFSPASPVGSCLTCSSCSQSWASCIPLPTWLRAKGTRHSRNPFHNSRYTAANLIRQVCCGPYQWSGVRFRYDR